MTKINSGQAVQLDQSTIDCVDTNQCELVREPFPEFANRCANPSEDLGVTHYTCDHLAELFVASTRTIQKRVEKVLEAYYWLPVTDIRNGQGKDTTYTLLAFKLLADLQKRPKGTTEKDWINQVHLDNPQQTQLETPAASQSSTSREENFSAPAAGGPLAIVTGVVPGEIALATDQQQSMLDSAIERFTPQPTQLNGQQDSNLSGLELLIGAVDQATAINDQRESDLQRRESTVEKSEQVLELVRDRLQTEQKRSKTLNRQAADIGEREQTVSDLLGKLGISQ